ncbi:hypothetical protein [Flavobacterium capsici]|uniref:Uncharacterized protein n=1 Tax=Flavobacterium capsici TaxID=3075618 RepID=A0AA96J612_9FLAO|nr:MULTISPECIES: hypothetical protein [unclassified Flavobacterium]WNM18192.1 hypothetical protein RN608_09215 [Flavobacterium sp. PMR2A8]WNM22243.1 hypothetical protein RN605_02515 [Flavobacterium sp. PMTSA4]
MQKQYKISFLVYSGMLVFALLFMLLLLGASGHRIKLNYQHYLIAFFAVTSISFLYMFPKMSAEKKLQKNICGVLCLILLSVSSYFALENLYSILTENLIAEFKIASMVFTGIFVTAIIYLLKQIFMEMKPNRNA